MSWIVGGRRRNAEAFWENIYCYVPHRDARIVFLKEIVRMLYSDGQLFMSQPILDTTFDSYASVYWTVQSKIGIY